MSRLAAQMAERTRRVQASAIREICKICGQPGMRSLSGGWPDPETYPVERISGIISDVLKSDAAQALQYGTSEGLEQLRSWLAGWIGDHDGVRCSAEQMVITHGSAQGMELSAKVFLDAGDVAFVGLPTYFGGTGACQTFGAELEGIPVDAEKGMDIEALRRRAKAVRESGRRAKLVYVIPDFQNPTGATMPVDNRRQLLQVAREHDLVIVEDSPYRDLCYDGSPPPPLKAFDEDGRVIYLRSFSKIFCPGFRLGVALGAEEIVRRMVIARQFEDCCPAAFGQHVLLEFCRRGFLQEQIEFNRKHYREKRDLLRRALEQHFPAGVRWNQPRGGFFFWVELPRQLDAEELLQRALERKVAFVPGASFFIDGGGRHTLRLSFAQASPAEIEAAASELGALLRERLGG